MSVAKIWLELALWLILAIAAYALTFEFDDEIGTYEWGAASWPRAIIGLLTIAAVVHCLMRLRSPVAVAARETTAFKLADVGMFAIPLIYVYLMPRTGFYLTTPLFLFAYLFYLGERRWRVLIFVPLLIFALVNLVFSKLFYVALPTGTWPGFYDFSNWFLTLIRNG